MLPLGCLTEQVGPTEGQLGDLGGPPTNLFLKRCGGQFLCSQARGFPTLGTGSPSLGRDCWPVAPLRAEWALYQGPIPTGPHPKKPQGPKCHHSRDPGPPGEGHTVVTAWWAGSGPSPPSRWRKAECAHMATTSTTAAPSSWMDWVSTMTHQCPIGAAGPRCCAGCHWSVRECTADLVQSCSAQQGDLL